MFDSDIETQEALERLTEIRDALIGIRHELRKSREQAHYDSKAASRATKRARDPR